jgi:hypothetical protein
VVLEEQLDQLRVRPARRVDVELEALRVIFQVVVGREALAASAIADPGAPDSVETPEPGIRGPESAQRERRGLELRRLLGVEEERLHRYPIVR